MCRRMGSRRDHSFSQNSIAFVTRSHEERTRRCSRPGGKLAVGVVLLETPHRLELDLDLSSSTFTAKWASSPLHQRPLPEMRPPASAAE